MMRTSHCLDRDTASRLASGTVHPDDAPPGFERVATLLAEAASVPEDVEPHQAKATISAMVAAIQAQTSVPAPTRAPRRVGRFVTAKMAVVAATLALGSGAAAAATGSLPDPLQDAVAEAVSHVGLDLPDSAEDHANVGGKSGDSHGEAPSEHPDTPGQGDVISGITHRDELEGAPKGPEVSPTASNDNTHVGEHGRFAGDTGAEDIGADDSDDPGRGANDGRATADQASGGASTAMPQHAQRP